MKVTRSLTLCVLLLLVSSSALASLEPHGNYLPPSSDYLPPLRSPSNSYIPASNDYYKSSHDSSSSSDSYYYPKPELTESRPATTYGVPEPFGIAKSYFHQRGYPRNQQLEDVWDEPAKYDFGYKIKDGVGNDYGHQEIRDGTKTRGRYFVRLADNRLMRVEYEADEHGYRPKITYENPSNYDWSSSADRAGSAYPGAPY